MEKEAEVVRLIYRLFLEGKTPSGIASYLTNEGIPTPSGKQKWQFSTVKSILTNEKYKGDAILQKGFTVDFLTKKRKVNEGEVPQYYVENSHPAIISRETFDLVQEEIRRRKSSGKYTSAVSCFACRIICGDCGGFYGRKIWHSNSKYVSSIWQCNRKFEGNTCGTPHLKEELIKRAFIEIFNSIIRNKNGILGDYDEIILKVTDYSQQERKNRRIEDECRIIEVALERLIAQNAWASLDQDEYSRQYRDYAVRYEELKKQSQVLSTEITRLKAKRTQIMAFIEEVKQQENLLEEFDESLWAATVNAVTIKPDKEIIFQFKDGTELPWRME